MFPDKHRTFAAVAAVAAFMVAATGASAATLSVGPGKTYAAPCAAIAAAQDGDTIEIAANSTYEGDACRIMRNGLTIRGLGGLAGRPKIDAAGKNAADKGIWVVDGNDITVDNVEMLGAAVMSGNGAALRLEARNFTLRNSFLHDNENGILSNAVPDSDILIENSEFAHNGNGTGQTHNLYIGKSKSLTLRYSYSHDADVGHNVKSRAITNVIAYNRISSQNPDTRNSDSGIEWGQPSYEIDLPSAGTSIVIGNIIQQPAQNQNPAIVAYGEEGPTNPGHDLYFVNNTVVNDFDGGGVFVFVSGKVTTPAVIKNNLFIGKGKLTSQASAILKSNTHVLAPDLGRLDELRHIAGESVIDAATDPGETASGVSLTPVSQYKDVAAGEPRPTIGALDIGAYEMTGNAVRGVAKTRAVAWTECAAENKTCSFSGTREVRFGAKGAYTSKVVTGSTACTVAVFGDPVVGAVKTCSIPSITTTMPAPVAAAKTRSVRGWVTCAHEGSSCYFDGTHEVRYGAAPNFVTKVFTKTAPCANVIFGDPAYGMRKKCSFQVAPKR